MRPGMPAGVDIILGNSLAGGNVWKGISLPPPPPIEVNTLRFIQMLKPAPLHPTPAIGHPFEHLIIDYVGLLPRWKTGSIYLLTIICQSKGTLPLILCTPLQLVPSSKLFAIPKIIRSDRWSNFTSHLFMQVLKKIHIKYSVVSLSCLCSKSGGIGAVPPNP